MFRQSNWRNVPLELHPHVCPLNAKLQQESWKVYPRLNKWHCPFLKGGLLFLVRSNLLSSNIWISNQHFSLPVKAQDSQSTRQLTPGIDFLGKNKLFFTLPAREHYPEHRCCESHVNLHHCYLRNEHWLGADFLIGHFEARSACACGDPCPLFLHAPLYNKTIAQHRRETGLSCSHSYQDGLCGVRRLKEVSVNNAIGFQLPYAQALMQNSALCMYTETEPKQKAGVRF